MADIGEEARPEERYKTLFGSEYHRHLLLPDSPLPNLDRAFFYQHFLGREQESGLVGQFLVRTVRRYRKASGGFPRPTDLALALAQKLCDEINHAKHTPDVDNYFNFGADKCEGWVPFGPEVREEMGGLRIVDGGSGLGRLLPLFSVSLGMHVTAIEPDLDYCAASTEQAKRLTSHFRSAVHLNVTSQSYSTLHLESHYDLIAIVNGGIYYTLGFRERLGTIQKLFDALRPGGLIVIDMANFLYHLAHTFPTPDRTIQSAYKDLMVHRRMIVTVNPHTAVWTHEDIFEVDGHTPVVERHQFAIIGPPELRFMLEHAGFVRIETYNNWSSTAPEELSESRLVMVAQKPEAPF